MSNLIMNCDWKWGGERLRDEEEAQKRINVRNKHTEKGRAISEFLGNLFFNDSEQALFLVGIFILTHPQ